MGFSVGTPDALHSPPVVPDGRRNQDRRQVTKTDLGKYFDKSRFQPPKLTGDVEFRVARKP